MANKDTIELHCVLPGDTITVNGFDDDEHNGLFKVTTHTTIGIGVEKQAVDDARTT